MPGSMRCRNGAKLWQTALCSAYIALDAELPGTNDYQGSLSKDDFGPVSITDIRLSQHVIRRRRQHLAQLDKDCYYLQILQKGHAQLVQGRHELPSNQAVAAMFYSGEPYDLQCLADIRALYLEIPRESLRNRLARQDFPSRATSASAAASASWPRSYASTWRRKAAPSRMPTRPGWAPSCSTSWRWRWTATRVRTRMATRIGRRG